jgi:hypothetical protein
MLAFCCQQGPQQMSRRFAESPDALEMRALKEDLLLDYGAPLWSLRRSLMTLPEGNTFRENENGSLDNCRCGSVNLPNSGVPIALMNPSLSSHWALTWKVWKGGGG